jgi:PilZ domain
MTIEKRIEAREPVKLPVTLADGSTGTTRDVSATGLFFEIDNKLELGGVVDFSIELSANGRSMLLTGQGEVVRIEARGKRTGVAARVLDSRLQAVG